MRTLLPHDERQDVTLRPAATAKVWLGVGQEHETVAVPGVGLGHGDVLIAVELSTICGSDVHTVQGHRSAPAPLVLGHESVGRVIAIGEGGATAADGAALRIGDRAVWSVTVSCGACDRCTAGLTQKCRTLAKYGHERIGPRWELTGGFASHVHLRTGTTIVRVPEALPAAVLAPASCATATAWAAVVRGAAGRSLEGMRVLVYGAGLVGLSAAAIAADDGADVTIVDPSPSRRAFAERFGAASAVKATEPADIVIEASGHAVADAIAAADVGGAVVLVGSVFPADPVPLEAENLVRRLLTVTGVHNYTGAELASAVGFLAGRGRAYPFADVVGAVHQLDDVDAALAAAAAPGAPLRVALNPR
ncbi:alcohol dehydrogenase catalytic domain-containing protein [Microbacterium profundi]|uniref:alcohol dehydrogenase catalytic domain-containing protein n=1 Tax=Microbacterium profundi TaxID=450380 RepID=UPI001F265415|nr:alcohol dehydrogenase catalytic domain-containing protein [Microbacterium profundi]MCE7482559.1 alcohol dehydrogenase catalytic domain-containing protein [Microbacterium profundi]